ncbi:uncharacterized protein LOC125474482 isoform X1 [Pyrus x bretschneideri]|uniref:uncharacterized protein LOC125474482 isoform X1 n=1 Tax=Pyrus x bretschneideri TaxID=225117 RepID=UPI0020302982|nr:uncharacterized protein LOC125474482 isoform X1 [Pyrus x bretschneideri]
MASNAPDEPCNSETEPETIALRIKEKRSRRVSFADTEITSVHIFNRDEDYDTPPDPKPQASSQKDFEQAENPVIGFFRDLGGDSDDFRDSDDDDENDDGGKSFFRPIGSPSPGSSVPGSATSNDEDNFFGPVSANFIRPGRLSDSAASDDIHEATLDTTAFSMHYHSLARSDSGGDLKTPTAVRLAFEEKTPTHNTNVTDSGSLISLTKPKMVTLQSSVPADRVRSGEDSNDMSIIEENPHKYDYGRLSPILDALLAGGSKDMHADSVAVSATSMAPNGAEVSASDENGIGHMRNGRTTEMGNFGTNDLSTEAESVSRIKLSESNGGYLHQTAYDASSNGDHNPAAGDSGDGQVQTQNQLNNVNKELSPEDSSPRGMKKLELTAVNGNVLPKVNSEALQYDVFVQHGPDYRHSSQGLVQEHSLKEKLYNVNSNQHLDQHYRSPMEGSIFLLSNTLNLERHSGIVTPSSKQPGSFLSAEHTKHNEWVSSIQKSISRFTLPEPSPCASSVKDGIEKLKCRLSSYSSVNSPLMNVMADIDRDLQCKFSNSHTACLEKQTAMPDLNGGQKSLFNMNSNGNENSINTSMLSQVNKTTDLDKVEEPRHSMFTYTPLKDAYSTPRNTVVSPSQLSLSGSKMTQHLMSETPTEGALICSGTDSLLAGEQEDTPPHLQIESEKNFQSPSRGAVILNSPDKSIQGGAEPMHSKPYVCSSTTEPYLQGFDILFGKWSTQSPSSKESGENPSMKGPIQSPPQENPTLNSTGRKAIQSSLSKAPSQSPRRKESTLSPPRKELTQSRGKEPIRSPFVKELTRSPIVRDPIQSPEEPIRSPFIKDMNWIPSRKESTNSPSRLDSSCAADTENVRPFAGKDLVSHESNSNSHPSDGCYQGLHISQNPFTGKDSENSVGQKRRNLGIISEDGYRTDTNPRIQKSPKVPRIENCNPEFMLHPSNKGYNDRQKCGGDTTWQCWTDILVKFSGDTEQLLSPLASKLNLRAIGVLEDMLVHLLKAKKYGMLCSEVQSQKFDCLNVGHKRVAEARLLLYKIVYEKAKLQLMQVKRDKLQSRVQLLSSAIQKSQMLKLNYICCLSEPSERETHVDDSHRQSSLVNSEGEQEASCDNVSTMRQELKALDRDVKSLSNFFHSHCKLKGEPSCADTISLVQHHLKTRTCCRIICHDLQLRKVDHFEIKNGHYKILLSYHGYLLQRFTGTVGPASNIVISHSFNYIKITKEFPNMDVQVAFGFVLNAEATKKSSDLRCFPLAQETQVTRSLLRNLLDVVEEVHLARFEIVNLIQTTFQTPSAEQLDLKLCFLNFKSGRQVAVTLDMTCLKSGVYPSEILPHQIQASSVSAVEKALPESLLAEMRAAAEILESGYTRIKRLCKCISNVV